MEKPVSLKMEYFKGIDLLRFLAAFCIILYHSDQALVKGGFQYKINPHHLYSGPFVLDLFFVITGFLIGTILLKEINAGQFSFRKFFLRRIFRIWPLYLFFIIVRVIIIPLGMGANWNEIGLNLSYALTFTTNFQIFAGETNPYTYKVIWSVCVEEHLYLIFPFTALLFKRRRLLMAALFIILGFISILFVSKMFPSLPGHGVRHLFTGTYFFYFGCGLLVAILYLDYPKLIQKISVLLNNIWFQLVVISLGLALVFNMIFPSRYPVILLVFLFGGLNSYLVFLAANGKLFFDVLGKKTSRFLGNISYGMYLAHPIVMLGIGQFIHPNTKFEVRYTFPLATVIGSIVIAIILHFLIERPFLKLKKNWETVRIG